MAQSDRQHKIELWAIYSILAVVVVIVIGRQIDFASIWPWERSVSGAKWGKILGGPKDDVISSIVALPDGGFAVAGRTESKGAGNKDAWVVRLDGKGRIVWDKTYGGPDADVAASIVVLTDGGFAVAGWTNSKGAGKADVWVLRLDSNGNLLWDKTFGGAKADQANSIVVLSDGSFAVAGWTTSKGSGNKDAWVLRLDGKGQRLWDKTFGGSSSSAEFNSIIVLPDNGFAVAGQARYSERTASTGRGARASTCIWCALVVRFDAKGRELWYEILGDSSINSAESIVALPDGDFIVVGRNNRGGFISVGAWILQLNGNGRLVWDKSLRGFMTRYAASIAALPDGGFAVVGSTDTRAFGGSDAWVLRLDKTGRKMWDRTIKAPHLQVGESIVALPDGGFAVAGWTCSKCPGDIDAWVLLLKDERPKETAK